MAGKNVKNKNAANKQVVTDTGKPLVNKLSRQQFQEQDSALYDALKQKLRDVNAHKKGSK
jgi:hypothetical protein